MSRALFVFLYWSHAVLSVIFGILRSFGIEICDPKKNCRKIFRRNKIRKLLVEQFLRKKSLKKSMKIQNFEISIFFLENFWNFKILNFHSFFQRTFFQTKIKQFWSKKNSTKRFRIFFDEMFFGKKNSGHLFRSQMIPRFRKSHLEQRATIIKIRTTPTK